MCNGSLGVYNYAMILGIHLSSTVFLLTSPRIVFRVTVGKTLSQVDEAMNSFSS